MTARATARSTRSTPRTSRIWSRVWTFSTGVIEGHEALPIINNGVMFVATLMEPGDRAQRQDR